MPPTSLSLSLFFVSFFLSSFLPFHSFIPGRFCGCLFFISCSVRKYPTKVNREKERVSSSYTSRLLSRKSRQEPEAGMLAIPHQRTHFTKKYGRGLREAAGWLASGSGSGRFSLSSGLLSCLGSGATHGGLGLLNQLTIKATSLPASRAI